MKLDLSLYLVLDPDLCGGIDGMVATAYDAVDAGVTVVQLRAPQWKKRLWLEAATRLREALAPLGVPLIINDHIDVALAVDADGVHVGQNDLPPDVARRLIGPHKILGFSVSNAEQMAAAPLAAIDYLGVGPAFPTATKPDASPVIGLPAFAELMRHKPAPAVAIGGIHADNAAQLISAGADGVAVVSAICGQPNVAVATRALVEVIEIARTT